MSILGIPLIDIAPFLVGSPAGKRSVAAEVGRACREIGFFTIVGHGVPKDLTEGMYAVSRAFFDLPLEEKMKVERPFPNRAPGYFPSGSRNFAYTLDQKTPPDLRSPGSSGPAPIPTTAR